MKQIRKINKNTVKHRILKHDNEMSLITFYDLQFTNVYKVTNTRTHHHRSRLGFELAVLRVSEY